MQVWTELIPLQCQNKTVSPSYKLVTVHAVRLKPCTFSSYLKHPYCSLKPRQVISEGWQTAQLPTRHIADTNAHWQQRSVSKNNFLSLASWFMQVCWRRMSGLRVLPPQLCSVPPEKKELALLSPPDKALLTTVYKRPFIPTVPKIATRCGHEMNTRLWIPFLYLQET